MVLAAIFTIIIFVIGLITLIMPIKSESKFPTSVKIIIGSGMMISGALILLLLMIITIPAGHIGVVYDPFAEGVQEYQLKEGFHIIMPWHEITQMSLRTITYNMHHGGEDDSIYVLTNEGLEIIVDLSIVYHIQSNKAWMIYKTIGDNYVNILLKPTARATIRDLIAFYKAEDLYTTEKRVKLQDELIKKLREQLEPRGIIIESALIRDINLPTGIKSAIEAKLQAEQDAKRMEFILQKEQKEAERKVVEAKGISESNMIIADSLTDSYLTWYWIQSLENQNSVIYVPIGNSGLPLFKNVDTIKIP